MVQRESGCDERPLGSSTDLCWITVTVSRGFVPCCWQVSCCSSSLYISYAVFWVFYYIFSKHFLYLSMPGCTQGKQSPHSFQGGNSSTPVSINVLLVPSCAIFTLFIFALHPHWEMSSAVCLILVRKVKAGGKMRHQGDWSKMPRAIGAWSVPATEVEAEVYLGLRRGCEDLLGRELYKCF